MVGNYRSPWATTSAITEQFGSLLPVVFGDRQKSPIVATPNFPVWRGQHEINPALPWIENRVEATRA